MTKYDTAAAPPEKVAPAPRNASNSDYKPMTADKYQRYVEAAAKGETYKGKQMLEVWREATHAGEAEVKQFLDDVAKIAFGEL